GWYEHVSVHECRFGQPARLCVEDARSCWRLAKAEVVSMEEIIDGNVVKAFTILLTIARDHPPNGELDHQTADLAQELPHDHDLTGIVRHFDHRVLAVDLKGRPRGRPHEVWPADPRIPEL